MPPALASRVAGNDLRSLIALAEGMRDGDADPNAAHPPVQPILFATGREDAILAESQALADDTTQRLLHRDPGPPSLQRSRLARLSRSRAGVLRRNGR